MNQLITFQGRSLLFNILFILFNLVGVTFITLGFHSNFEDYSIPFLMIGGVLVLATIFGLILFHGRMMMSSVARVLVGGLCIVSGLIKANDPIGFSYKLGEYFEDGALAYRIKELFGMPSFSLEFLIDFSLPLSIFICLLEIILGVLLIIGGKIKIVSYVSLLMILFFSFLTWHTANCDPEKKFIDRDTYAMSNDMALLKMEAAKLNKGVKIHSKTADFLVVDEWKTPQCVDDCGCFGDAMKGSVGRSLTPLESFWKDIILLYLIIWIFCSQWIILPNNKKQNLYFTLSSLLLIGFFSWVFGWGFPVLFGILVIVGSLWILRAGGEIFGNYGGVIFMVSLISGLFISYVLMYEPVKDYRPFAVGNNLKQKMSDGVIGKYESLLNYKNIKTGEEKNYSSSSKEYTQSKIWEDKNWVFKKMVSKTVVPTKLPSINDFDPFIKKDDITNDELRLDFIREKIKENEGETEISIKDLILKSKKICLLSSSDLKHANFTHIAEIKSIYYGCVKSKIPFIIICNASRREINAFKKKYDFKVPVFVNDEKSLMAVSRSNPALLVVQNAIVKGKFPHRSLPKFETLKSTILNKK